MLKSTLTPILTTIPAKAKLPKLKHFSGTPQTIRQNASLNNHTPLHTPQPPTSAYIHLPFCRKRCHYCDFPIIALGSSSPETADTDPRILNYIQTICKEIKATPSNSNLDPPLKTVFFGGGTPSLVPPRLVSLVLDTLNSKFSISSDAEISMEMDPGTFDSVKLKDLMKLGVNRVSLGVQAFQQELLKACGRAHGVDEIFEAVKILKSCEVENWSMDLISSLPHQTTQMWEESLKLTIQAQPTHVSVYDLQVEQGTKFGVLYSPGEFPLPCEDQSAEFYKMASRTLRNGGYDHYEISSYSKSNYQCKHNVVYWKNKPFFGFGLGSASFLNGVRFSRPRKLKDYLLYVQNLEDGLVKPHENSSIDMKDMAMDVIMLSLRTSRGLDLKLFKEAFGGSIMRSVCKVYEPYIESGHVVCFDKERRNVKVDEFKALLKGEECEMFETIAFIRLSDPEGFLLSNELISLAFGVISP